MFQLLAGDFHSGLTLFFPSGGVFFFLPVDPGHFLPFLDRIVIHFLGVFFFHSSSLSRVHGSSRFCGRSQPTQPI